MTSVAVLGSGLFGIAAVRSLQRTGFEVTWLSEDEVPGGLWHEESRAGKVYPSLLMITPHGDSVFGEDRAHVAEPDRFLRWREYAEYLSRAVPEGKEKRVFGVRVRDCRPLGGSWEVRADGGFAGEFDWIVNATGRNNRSRGPALPDGGTTYRHAHSSEYRQLASVQGARCLVIGLGQSGVDIASDLALRGNDVDCSFRSPSWIVPKYLLGKPARVSGSSGAVGRVTSPVKRRLTPHLLRLLVGRQEKWGLPEPAGGAMPVVSDLFLHVLRHGLVTLRPAVGSLGESSVRFVDGSEGRYDVVVSATGYEWALPHLPSDVRQSVRDDGLLLGMVPPAVERLILLNGFRCKGAAMACAEIQAGLLPRVVSGEIDPARDARPIGHERARAGLTGADYRGHLRDHL
ncbi:FAD-dependent oxidoreductase [Amycolatopsis sp. NPDC005003]